MIPERAQKLRIGLEPIACRPAAIPTFLHLPMLHHRIKWVGKLFSIDHNLMW